MDFLANTNIFKDATIEKEEHDKSLEAKDKLQEGNPMLKGVISLEKLYDFHNCFKGPTNTKTKSSTLMHK